jgi:hypothetical protein
VTDPYRVVIPSFQRPERLFEQTLTTLKNKGVPLDLVDVFLHDNDPRLDDYLNSFLYVDATPVVTPARGIGQQRQAIVDHYPEGTRLVGMDDDIEEVIATTGPRWANVFNVPDLHSRFVEMFNWCDLEGLYVWGTAPVNNPFFMKEWGTPPSVGLKLCMFTLFGWVNRPGHPVHTQTVQYKDEQEFSLRAWWYDGAVLRADDMAVKTVFYADGGCTAAGRNWQQVEDSVVSLMQQWPDLVTRNTKKGSEWPEIKLARRQRTNGHPVDSLPPGGEPLF